MLESVKHKFSKNSCQRIDIQSHPMAVFLVTRKAKETLVTLSMQNGFNSV